MFVAYVGYLFINNKKYSLPFNDMNISKSDLSFDEEETKTFSQDLLMNRTLLF